MRNVKSIISICLVSILVFTFFLPTNQTNANVKETIFESWKNVHLVVSEKDYTQPEVREIIWDYYRNDQNHWIKKIREIKGASNPENHIGYYLSFNGEKISEYYPNSKQLFNTKVEVGEQHEADFFIQPQRVFEIKKHKNIPSKVQFNGQEFTKLEVKNTKSNSIQSYIYSGDFIKMYTVTGLDSEELVRSFEVVEVNKINNKTFEEAFNSNSISVEGNE